jgi:uncharacterized protein YggE
VPPSITTDAVGRREATPELASVTVTAVAGGGSAAAARAAARDRAAGVRTAVTATVRTVELRVEESGCLFDPDTDAAYQATERLVVDCVPETVETAVVEATDAGGTVTDVEFRLRDDVRQRLEGEALEAAIKRARRKAERVAAAEGLAVTGVREVRTDDGETGTGSLVDQAIGASPDHDVHPSPVVVSAGVEVVYDCDPA